MAFKFHIRWLYPIFWAAFYLFISIECKPSFAIESKRIILLHSFGPDVKPWSDYARAIRTELSKQSPWHLEFYEPSLVSARFNDENPEVPFVQYLRALFSKKQPDLIISIGAPAAALIQRHRKEFFPSTPMLLTIVDQTRVKYSALTDNDAVVAVAIDYLRAFKNIVQVLPDTKSVVVITGNSPIERYWKTEIERQVATLTDRIELKWTDDLSFEDILKRTSMLPPHTAIFWELMVVDAAGVPHEEGIALAKLRSVATAPIFSYTDAFFGDDIVGGPQVPILEAGQQTAQVAVRILNGEKASDIKTPPVGMGAPKFDWRQLQRWNILESNLPPNSQIYFRDPNIWERYRWQIVAIVVVILLQVMLIQGLLYHRHRRQRAEIESKLRTSELARINRQTVVSGMSAAIAHEINQPLSAILNNAETAEIILRSDNPNLTELRNIMSEIRSDDWRASEIIRRLRSLISKGEIDFKSVDLNEIAREAIRIASIQAHDRDIKIHENLTTEPLPLIGDPIQLQQVIMNLVMNSIDSISECSRTEKEIIVQTTRVDNWTVEFSIADTGTGIDTDKLGEVFTPFFTTRPTGIGMGLSLAQTIIESHGGKIWAENRADVGAIFRFRLDLARQ